MNRCPTPYCKNKVKGNHLCSTCRYRKWRLANPVRYAYNNLKNRAKQRGVMFTITFEDFEQWCVKVQYIGMKNGRGSDARTVDRRYNDIGYHLDNIQVMTKRNNVKKYFSYDYRNKAVRIEEKLPLSVALDGDGEPLPF